ncbi:MAG TPA: hypothetical protein VN874_05225 [Myxococcales bacterium]|jgi:hypothetical protein|nr:hypothetical protein [Myxococcales bacterium]
MGEHLSVEALETLAASDAPPTGQEAARGPLAGDAEAKAHFAHLRECAACARELAWLRAELLLVARRREAQGPLPASLWQGILARVSPQAGGAGHSSSSAVARASRPRTSAPWAAGRPVRWMFAPGRRARAAFALAAATAAAVVLVLALRPRAVGTGATGSTDGVALRDDLPDPSVGRALDRAEGDSRAAAGVLETEYRAGRSNLDAATARSWDKSLAAARSQLDSARALAGNDVEARMRILDGYAVYLRSLRAVVVSSEEAAP